MRLVTALIGALALLGPATPAGAHIYTFTKNDPIVVPDIFRPATAEWFWMSSLTGQIHGIQGGVPGLDKPARRP